MNLKQACCTVNNNGVLVVWLVSWLHVTEQKMTLTIVMISDKNATEGMFVLYCATSGSAVHNTLL